LNTYLVANTNYIIVLKNLNVVDGAVGDGEDAGGPLLGLDDGAEAVHVADVTAINVQDRTKTLKTIDQILNRWICQKRNTSFFYRCCKRCTRVAKKLIKQAKIL